MSDKKGETMTLSRVIDEHFLRQYRELLDAEDSAFDDLEHAYEDGDRVRYEADIQAWEVAIERRLAFLARLGMTAQAAPVG